MTPIRIASIVEGDGEVEAVPVLIGRFARRAGYQGGVEVLPPIRQPASRLVRKPGELERIVELSARKLKGPGGILLLLDCEDDCPAVLGPALLSRVRTARGDIPISVVLAHREFEAWFLAGAPSLAGKRGLPPELSPHSAPESVRGCKEWLSQQMPYSRRYREVDDQAALTESFDWDMARSACPSFDKCHRELASLLKRVAEMTSGRSSPCG